MKQYTLENIIEDIENAFDGEELLYVVWLKLKKEWILNYRLSDPLLMLKTLRLNLIKENIKQLQELLEVEKDILELKKTQHNL